MKKRGFTLLELIAAIAIIGVLAIIVLPNFVKLFNNSLDSSMKIAENNTLDAANLYIEDYCRNPISSGHLENCNNDKKEIDSDTVYFCLANIQNKGYLQDVNYKESTPCKGVIVYDYEDYDYKNGKVYLLCGLSPNYSYATEGFELYRLLIEDC